MKCDIAQPSTGSADMEYRVAEATVSAFAGYEFLVSGRGSGTTVSGYRKNAEASSPTRADHRQEARACG